MGFRSIPAENEKKEVDMLLETYVRQCFIFWLCCLFFMSTDVKASDFEAAKNSYRTYGYLHNAITEYYLIIKQNSEPSTAMTTSDVGKYLQEASFAISNPSVPDKLRSAAITVIARIKECSEFVEAQGYPYPVAEQDMEEAYENFRKQLVLLYTDVNEVQLMYTAYDSLSHVLHNYYAIHAAQGGDGLNPVIARQNIAQLAMDADSAINALVAQLPGDQSILKLKAKWQFLKGPISKWQQYEVIYLVNHYQFEMLNLLQQKIDLY